MLCTAIANDAWLHAMAPSLPPGAHVMGTFPGLLVTDLAASTFPAWLLPLVKHVLSPPNGVQVNEFLEPFQPSLAVFTRSLRHHR